MAGAVFAAVLLGGADGYARINMQRMDLPNQLVVLVSEEHSLPFVTMNLLVDAGAWRDPDQESGLANLTAESLLLGTSGHSAAEINESLDFMGASLNVTCGFDYATFTMKSLKRELEGGFGLFMEIITRPAFPREEIGRKKQEILGRIESEKDDPSEIARQLFRETVYIEGPYSQPVKGTEKTLTALDREMVAEFYRSYYRPNIAVFAVVGDITMQEVKSALVPMLSQWQAAEIPETPTGTRFARGPETTQKNRPISQANIVMGHGGIPRSSPDYYAVLLMNRILGGSGLSSRLMKRVRVERGLAYSVRSFFKAGRHPGTFQVALQTSSASANEAVELVLKEMKRIRRQPVSPAELDTAQKYLIGSFPLRLDTQSQLAAFLAMVVYYELGSDYAERYPSLIRSVSRKDVLKAAKRYLHPDGCIVSIVGNLADIDPAGP